MTEPQFGGIENGMPRRTRRPVSTRRPLRTHRPVSIGILPRHTAGIR